MTLAVELLSFELIPEMKTNVLSYVITCPTVVKVIEDKWLLVLVILDHIQRWMCYLVVWLPWWQRWMLIDWWILFEVIDSLLTAEANWIELNWSRLCWKLIVWSACLWRTRSLYFIYFLRVLCLWLYQWFWFFWRCESLYAWMQIKLTSTSVWVKIALWLSEGSLWSECWMSGNTRMAWPEAPHNKRLLCLFVVCGACACGEYESLIVLAVICTACVVKLCFGHFWMSLIGFCLWSPHVVGDCLFVAKDRYRADGAPNVTAVRVLWCWTVNWLMKLWWMWLLCNAVLVTAMHRMCRRLSVYVQRSVVKWWWTLRASRQSLLSL